MVAKKGRGRAKAARDAGDWDKPGKDTAITQHTKTQALDDEAQQALERDVETAKSSDPILVVIRGNAQGKKHTISEGSITVGRSRQAEIRVLDPSVSSKHAKIIRAGNSVFIEDLGSNNGTYVNNERISTRRELHKEDMITVGTTILKYVPAGELEILYHGNLIKAAYVDSLTGVYNHNYISEALEAEFKRAKALGQKFSIILIDVDNFKQINDGFGHGAGDHALREFCQLSLANVLRASETIGRYGGDEFLVLLWNTTAAEAAGVAERLRRLVAETKFLYDGNQLPVSISCGVASMTAAHKTVADFFKAADRALYESKAKGRNCVSISEK